MLFGDESLKRLSSKHRVLKDLQAFQGCQATPDREERRFAPLHCQNCMGDIVNMDEIQYIVWIICDLNGSFESRETRERVNLVPEDHQDLQGPQDQESDLWVDLGLSQVLSY